MGQNEPLTAEQTAIADYIDDMAAQLALMARSSGLNRRADALEGYVQAWPSGSSANDHTTASAD